MSRVCAVGSRTPRLAPARGLSWDAADVRLAGCRERCMAVWGSAWMLCYVMLCLVRAPLEQSDVSRATQWREIGVGTRVTIIGMESQSASASESWVGLSLALFLNARTGTRRRDTSHHALPNYYE